MRVTELEITNFRSFDSEERICFSTSQIALVGSNNSGKSTVLTALAWVLGSSAPYQIGRRVERDDYFNPAKPIVIGVTLGGVDARDKARLMSLATNKNQRGALSKKNDPTIILTLMLPPFEISDAEVGEKADAARASLAVSMWGFPVHRGQTQVRNSLIQLVDVSSYRRPDDDLNASRWTPYGQLMKSVLETAPQYRELQKLLLEINSKVQEAFADQKDALLSGAQVVSYLDDIGFQLTKENNPTELLRNLQILVTEDGRTLNLDRLGTGTQSAVIIGMLELVLRAKSSESRVFAIEEPDAFIHPHGIRHLAELLRRIGQNPNTQVVLSTHSPTLLATLSPGDLVRIEKQEGRSVVFQSPGTLTDPEFARLLDQDNAEMFFARRVVLVEGPTERFLLPPLSRMVLHKGTTLDFDRRRISVVEMGGKTGVINFLRLLDEFRIDTRVILDRDFLGDPNCAKLVAYLRSKGKEIDDSSQSALGKDLWRAGICVLRKGEVENYIPEGDAATVSGRSLPEVQEMILPRASQGFKKLFGLSKPMYARQLANFYVRSGTVPQDLERLIVSVAT